MPGDVAGFVTHEVFGFERCPKAAVGLGVEGIQAQDVFRLDLARLSPATAVATFASQMTQRQPVEVFQQLAFPSVPDLWAGASDVGHGEQIERCQRAFVRDLRTKAGNHRRVSEVLFLRGRRHQQVAIDQELDQARVVAVDPVAPTKAADIQRPQSRVVAAAALGDVVVQRRDVDQRRPLEFGHQPAAERVLVGKLGLGEAADVAQHHQDVLVDRVDVE